MKIHTALISYNRYELTRQALTSYAVTLMDAGRDFSVTVVDNGSDEHTAAALTRWGKRMDASVLLLEKNWYPGFATNRGWELAPPDTDLLHRADNDFVFLPGWHDEVERMFTENPRLGQLGLRTDEEELFHPQNVGGNCVIRRELWDDGLRWDERAWPEIKPPGITEDSFMSPAVRRMGWQWDRVERPCIQPISVEDPDDPYYVQSWRDRGITRS